MEVEEKKYKCGYCVRWGKSPIKKGLNDEGKKNKVIKRKCIITGKLIEFDSESCKYFAPAEVIYCENNQIRINLLNCLQRRRNPKEFKSSYSQCKKCRQYDRELFPILEDYYLSNKKIIVPQEKIVRRTIKRRKGHDKKRVIKRRQKSTKRKIKRRSPLTKGLDIILPKKRKIKRR